MADTDRKDASIIQWNRLDVPVVQGPSAGDELEGPWDSREDTGKGL